MNSDSIARAPDTFDPVLNRELIEGITAHQNGDMTKLASAGTDYIRTHIREGGWLRKVMPPKPISDDELDRLPDHDRPIVTVDLQPGHKGAISVPFNVSSNTEFFYGPRGVIEFFEIKSPVFTKNVNELRTYRMDIRKIITEQMLNDIETKEDGLFLALVDSIVGDVGSTGDAGFQQHFRAGDGSNNTTSALGTNGITRSSYVEAKKFLERARLNNGVFLMNRSTSKEFEKFDRTELGGDLSEKIWKNGLKAIGDATIGGVPMLFSVKDELIADNVIYAFAPSNFLGQFRILQDVTMFAEKRQNIITTQASETIGVGLLNVAGVAKIDFSDGSTAVS